MRNTSRPMRQIPRGVPTPAATLTTSPLLDEPVGVGSAVVLVADTVKGQ